MISTELYPFPTDFGSIPPFLPFNIERSVMIYAGLKDRMVDIFVFASSEDADSPG